MNCPNCGSTELYRRHPHSLIICCERCDYSFDDKQPQHPILCTGAYRRSQPRGMHLVSAWHCPTNSERYSFSITYGGGIVKFDEFPDDPYLKGCYATPQEALYAGIAEVKEQI